MSSTILARNAASETFENYTRDLKCYGDHSFDYYGPCVGNSLPLEIRDSDNLTL